MTNDLTHFEKNERPIGVFMLFAREEAELAQELDEHLLAFENDQTATISYAGKAKAGQIWDDELKSRLENADLILLLVSEAYKKSEILQQIAVPIAKARVSEGEALALPVLVGACSWENKDFLKSLPIFKPEGKALADFGNTKAARDEAWGAVVQQISALFGQISATLEQKRKQAIQREKQLEAERRGALEQQQWRAAKKENTLEAFRAYLAEFPNGWFSEEATDAIAKLEIEAQKKANEAARRAEDYLWMESFREPTLESYQRYLDKYPNGFYAEEAQECMRKLRNEPAPAATKPAPSSKPAPKPAPSPKPTPQVVHTKRPDTPAPQAAPAAAVPIPAPSSVAVVAQTQNQPSGPIEDAIEVPKSRGRQLAMVIGACVLAGGLIYGFMGSKKASFDSKAEWEKIKESENLLVLRDFKANCKELSLTQTADEKISQLNRILESELIQVTKLLEKGRDSTAEPYFRHAWLIDSTNAQVQELKKHFN